VLVKTNRSDFSIISINAMSCIKQVSTKLTSIKLIVARIDTRNLDQHGLPCAGYMATDTEE